MGDRDYTFYTYEIRNMLWNMLLLNDVCRSIYTNCEIVYTELWRKPIGIGYEFFMSAIKIQPESPSSWKSKIYQIHIAKS